MNKIKHSVSIEFEKNQLNKKIQIIIIYLLNKKI